MSIERTYYCDGPANPELVHQGGDDVDRCPGHATTASQDPDHMPMGMLKVLSRDRELHFCGWDCVLRFAAKIPPPVIVQLDE